mmetsp:Transcript_24375/g.51706  ORF Transcript_24375/g.51706 Transcript_24375/m.51706 type:complete len:544 (-) Transcript_24375:781-2412(-)
MAKLKQSNQRGGEKKVPNGITTTNRGRSHEKTSLRFNGGSVKGHPYKNTFSVEAQHEFLPNKSGVRFNVETVPAALEEDLNKVQLDKAEVLNRIKTDASSFYGDSICKTEDIRLEAVAETPETIVFSGGSGFLAACLTAFAQHLPLELSPDHIWAVLSYAFAKHVDTHAEELRKNFVQHEGKKRLLVEVNGFVMSGGDLEKGTSAAEWEQKVFPGFSRQIKEHIGEKVHATIASDFTTTTNTARAAHEITLMSAMKNYFSYGMSTCCGIPNITLFGSESDWTALRARAENLGNLMTPAVRDAWMPYLLPVLDEFVESYKGNVKHGFWQSMVKLRGTSGSGAYDFISGWLQIFFPYLRSGAFNTRLRPWHELYFEGPDSEDFPTIVSSAPVDWDYYGVTHDLHFHSGITGYTQDPNDGTLAPLIGWYVTHDLPKDPDMRLEKVKQEIEALIKGHEAEARAVPLDKDAPWYVRVQTLYLEQLSLEAPARRIALKRNADTLRRECRYEYYEALSEMKKLNETIEKENESSSALTTDAMIGKMLENA